MITDKKRGVDSFSGTNILIISNNQAFCCTFVVEGLASLVEDSIFSILI